MIIIRDGNFNEQEIGEMNSVQITENDIIEDNKEAALISDVITSFNLGLGFYKVFKEMGSVAINSEEYKYPVDVMRPPYEERELAL